MQLFVAFAAVAALAFAVRGEEWRRRAPRLSTPDLDPPATTVLLPVRDEEANVLLCLAGLLAQTAPAEIRVVDDDSRDRSAELVRRLAASEPRLALLSAGELPSGWRGKVHALARGAAGAATPWLLATDADTRHHPELLARAHAATRRFGLDALSLAGDQQARGIGEQLLTAPVFALLDTLLGDWEATSRGAGRPVANGQFFLVRRDALDAIGGYESIRGAVIDDVALARKLVQSGFRVGFWRAPELLEVRMYRGLRATLNGWRRNLGGLLDPGTAAAALGILALAIAGPLLAAMLGRWLEAVALWTAGAAVSALFRRGSGNLPAAGLLFPLDAFALGVTVGLGLVDRMRGQLAPWKGRPMPLN